MVDLGDNLQLHNTSRHDVTVLGYDDEPYLRVGPRRRVREPSVTGDVPQPDAHPHEQAAEVGRLVGNTRLAPGVVGYHRHLARPSRPLHGHVGSARGAARSLGSPCHRPVDGRSSAPTAGPCAHSGELLWVPPPSPWPYVVLALVVAVGVFVLTRTRVWRTAFAVGLGAAGAERSRARGRALERDHRVDRVQARRERVLARRDRAERCSRSCGCGGAAPTRRCRSSSSPRSSCSSPEGSPTSSTLGHSQIPTTLPYGGRPALDHARPRSRRRSRPRAPRCACASPCGHRRARRDRAPKAPEPSAVTS